MPEAAYWDANDNEWVLPERNAAGEAVGRAVARLGHHMEIRGLGILSVPDLFGPDSVRDSARVDLICRLDPPEQGREYERVGIERFLQKPVDVESIKLSIRQLIDQGGIKIGPKRIGYSQALAELSQGSQVVMTGSDTLRVAQMMRAHAEELKRG